jgi:hypothetical protein
MWESIEVFPRLAAAYEFARSLPDWTGIVGGITYAIKRGPHGNLYAWQWRPARNVFAAPPAVLEAAAMPDKFDRRAAFLAPDFEHWLVT